jgi:hypothetical protein
VFAGSESTRLPVRLSNFATRNLSFAIFLSLHPVRRGRPKIFSDDRCSLRKLPTPNYFAIFKFQEVVLSRPLDAAKRRGEALALDSRANNGALKVAVIHQKDGSTLRGGSFRDCWEPGILARILRSFCPR